MESCNIDVIRFVFFQLFRRVAAALPGMDQTEPKKEDSILPFIKTKVEVRKCESVFINEASAVLLVYRLALCHCLTFRPRF